MKVLNIRLISWLTILLIVGFVLAADSTSINSQETAATTTAKTTSVAVTTTAKETTTGGTTTKDATTTGGTTATTVTTKNTQTTATTKAAASSDSAATTKAASATTSTSISYSAIVITAVNTNNDGSSGSKPTLSKSKMPTLSTTGVPVPTVTVPSNEFNPFLKQSTIPEGTVFIAVGSILGAIALAVIAWNVALAIIHRRNARHFHDIGSDPTPLMTDIKDFNHGYNAGNNGAGAGGNNNLEHGGGVGMFGASNKDASRSRSMINSGLFFSPTAQVLNSAQGQNNLNSANPSITSSMASSTAGVGVIGGPGRASVYMPAGYYDGTGNGGARSVRHMSMYSMSNASMGGGHQSTPPPMPLSSLSVSNSAGNPRISQLATGEQQQPRQSVRAPSAYLDDFLGFDK
jgi:hypothetical protein